MMGERTPPPALRLKPGLGEALSLGCRQLTLPPSPIKAALLIYTDWRRSLAKPAFNTS